MSYLRFSEGDAYVYLDIDGYLNCMACQLGKLVPGRFGDVHRSFHASTTAEMVAHLAEHRAAGHDIPEDVTADLLRDAVENDAWIAGRAGQGKRPSVQEAT